jgi:short-subunit dehydrogenase
MSKTALITGQLGIGKANRRNLSKNNYKIILCGSEDRMVELEKNFQN